MKDVAPGLTAVTRRCTVCATYGRPTCSDSVAFALWQYRRRSVTRDLPLLTSIDPHFEQQRCHLDSSSTWPTQLQRQSND